jgi:protein gp37
MTTAIQWCDETWNPLVGCTRVSAGCDHCYAIGVAARQMSPQHRGLTKLRPRDAKRPGPDWTGEVRTVPAKLAEPLHWRKPRRVFVNSMSDLFHAQVPFEFIAAVFGVMAACPQHTFLVLTKRPERAREFFAWVDEQLSAGDSYYTAVLGRVLSAADGHLSNDAWDAVLERTGFERSLPECEPWPLPNVHLGTSVEDQATADARIPELLCCPAGLHWVSAEPLLDHVDLCLDILPKSGPHIEWVVVGGESGPGARAFDIAWARSIVEQCRERGVPVFVKQLGAMPIGDIAVECRLLDRKGGDMDEWPADLRVREVPT